MAKRRWLFCLRWLVVSLVTGMVFFALGVWCSVSNDLPALMFRLPLPERFLAGLALLFLFPPSLIPCSILVALTWLLVSKLNHVKSKALMLGVSLVALFVGSWWVPNPIVLWPTSWIGSESDAELIRKLFPVHIISPDWIHTAKGDITFRWQLAEIQTRSLALCVIWLVVLVMIYKLTMRRPEVTGAGGSA